MRAVRIAASPKTTFSFEELDGWLRGHGVERVVVESTGRLHWRIHRWLHDRGHAVFVGRLAKTYRIDAEMLAGRNHPGSCWRSSGPDGDAHRPRRGPEGDRPDDRLPGNVTGFTHVRIQELRSASGLRPFSVTPGSANRRLVGIADRPTSAVLGNDPAPGIAVAAIGDVTILRLPPDQCQDRNRLECTASCCLCSASRCANVSCLLRVVPLPPTACPASSSLMGLLCGWLSLFVFMVSRPALPGECRDGFRSWQMPATGFQCSPKPKSGQPKSTSARGIGIEQVVTATLISVMSCGDSD